MEISPGKKTSRWKIIWKKMWIKSQWHQIRFWRWWRRRWPLRLSRNMCCPCSTRQSSTTARGLFIGSWNFPITLRRIWMGSAYIYPERKNSWKSVPKKIWFSKSSLEIRNGKFKWKTMNLNFTKSGSSRWAIKSRRYGIFASKAMKVQ